MKVSDAIKRAAKDRKLTQTDIADRIGVGQTSVAMFLKRDASMKVDNMLRMANACDFDVVLVDRSNVKNMYVVGERDEIEMLPGDEAFDDAVRKIVEEELAKRD